MELGRDVAAVRDRLKGSLRRFAVVRNQHDIPNARDLPNDANA